MILFLENIAECKRGGEVYLGRFYDFIKIHFPDVYPDNLEQLAPQLRNPIKHMYFKKKMVEEYQPDIVFTDISSAFRSFLAAYSMKKMKKAIGIIVQEERQDFRYNIFFMKWLVRRFERYLLANASFVIANSKYIAKRTRRFIRKDIPIIIAYPGIELSMNTRSLIDSDFNLDKPPYELLFVGHCAYRKGLKFLVEAIKYLNEINVRLNIAGGYDEDSRYYREIKQIIRRNSLEDKIIFHGYLDRQQIDVIYRKNCIFVMPSLAEGYGMALAEALSYGLPIVASRVGAIPDNVVDEVNALLVPPGSPAELARAIRRLCQDSGLRDKMRQANLEKAKNLPTWDDFYKVLDGQLMPLLRNSLLS